MCSSDLYWVLMARVIWIIRRATTFWYFSTSGPWFMPPTSRTFFAFSAFATSIGLDTLVEVHDADELRVAIDVGAKVIGVNNRNLRTLVVDVHASESLVAMMPKGVVAVSESGLKSRADLARLSALGYGAFLIGERFMTDPDPGAALSALLERA